MSNQPPHSNDPFDADLQAIENAMNNMMQGAFSMMFKEVVGSSDIFEQFPTQSNTTTTILDGRNINTAMIATEVEDEFGGSDFKRLANKHKKQKPVDELVMPKNNQNSNAKSIFNLLFPAGESMHNSAQVTEDKSLVIEPSKLNLDDNGSSWSFTSTSQKTTYQPDGTQETITTKKTNGVTETIKQVRFSDGRMEETKEISQSIWNRLLGRS